MLILDLCSGTGSWSLPYKQAGYDVLEVEKNDGLDVLDWREWLPNQQVHGILAAPPCTDFASSGARWFKDKDLNGSTQHSLDIVDACLQIIEHTNPVWWALENPVGRLPRLRPNLGKPTYEFDPYDFGDYYSKRTYLWGNFNPPLTLAQQIDLLPQTTPSELLYKIGQRQTHLQESLKRRTPYIHYLGSKNQVERSITPPSFAKAFFNANP